MSETYRAEDWPHGLRCGECLQAFTAGVPIAEQFSGLIGEVPAVVPVCVPCGLAVPVGEVER